VKKIVAFILLISIAIQSFSQGIVVLQFKVQRNYIAKNLCVNRSKPMLHCNGKCALAKKLRQQEKKQETPDLKLPGKADVISSRSFFVQQLTLATSIRPVYSDYSEAPLRDLPTTFFHPPCW